MGTLRHAIERGLGVGPLSEIHQSIQREIVRHLTDSKGELSANLSPEQDGLLTAFIEIVINGNVIGDT